MIKDGKTWLLASAVAAVALVALFYLGGSGPSAAPRDTPLLRVYCAAGLKPPVEACARAYEQAYGVRVELQYGGSGTLLSSLRVAGRGDLFLAADESYLLSARSNALVAEIIPLARMTPVIAVRKGNPAGIRGLGDLARVSVALANPDAAAIGRITRERLRASGHWAGLEAQAKVFKPTVNDVANDILLGTVDAGIIWDATARQYPGLEAIPDPAFTGGDQRVSVGLLESSEHPAAALRFARYLGAPERGLPEFERHGYTGIEGDSWAEVPEVVLFSGGVNRVAIEETLQRFEEREGVRITRVYNGCGILVAQMRAGQEPDAYFACDISFMRQVTNLFPSALNVARTPMVLLVPRGNPKGLRALADLAQPGLRLGVANPEQSALGALTARLLAAQGLTDRVAPNVRVQTPTADLLVNQMRSGSLDAVVVYAANTSAVRDALTVVPLPDPDATATQPYAIQRNSRHRLLLGRLQDTLRSAESRHRFESAGFQWIEEAPAP